MSDFEVINIFEPLECEIRKRIKLNSEAVKELAAAAGIGQFADELFAELSGYDEYYVTDRIREIVSTQRKRYEGMPVTDPDDWWYDPDAKKHWEEAFPTKRGQPAHETLLEICRLLYLFWNRLPVDANKKRRREKWSPRFEKQFGDTVPCNKMGELFLGVVRLFDYKYSAANCLSVADRVKNLRRSPAGWAKLRERKRIQTARYREKQKRLRAQS
jgi:hypothetical protein